jgi:hypothetical protein
MERFIRSLKLLWKSERLLAEQQLKLATSRLGFSALAGLIAVFGLAMVNAAAFFALAPRWGQAWAALAVGLGDIALAAALVAYAQSLKPGTEIEIVKEVRDAALTDLEEEAALTQAEVAALRDEIRRFLRNPLDALLPEGVGALLRAFTGGLGLGRK